MTADATVRVVSRGGALHPEILRGPALPIERLLVGRPVEEVAALLPRLFSLCGSAQSAAIRLALGLPAGGPRLPLDILRDHLLKLFVVWPALLGLRPGPLPRDWTEAGPLLRRALFGPSLAEPMDLEAFLADRQGVAPLFSALRAAFRPHEAAAPPLPGVRDDDPLCLDARENSVAARHATHPVVAAIEAAWGRGPLWRAYARLADVAAILSGRLPAPRMAAGTALVAAARGTYAVRARTEGPVVASFARATPTDHALAPGGVLERSIATLPAVRRDKLALLVDIIDPCVAVRIAEVQDA